MSPRIRRYKLLLDEMLPRREKFPVLNRTHDIKHILHDLRKSGIKDYEVLEIAKKQERILITKNIKDFQEECKRCEVDVFGVTETMLPEELDRIMMAELRRHQGRMTGLFTKITRPSRKVRK